MHGCNRLLRRRIALSWLAPPTLRERRHPDLARRLGAPHERRPRAGAAANGRAKMRSEFSISEVAAWDEFTDKLDARNSGVWVYRGQSRDWPLASSLERRLKEGEIDLKRGPTLNANWLANFDAVIEGLTKTMSGSGQTVLLGAHAAPWCSHTTSRLYVLPVHCRTHRGQGWSPSRRQGQAATSRCLVLSCWLAGRPGRKDCAALIR